MKDFLIISFAAIFGGGFLLLAAWISIRPEKPDGCWLRRHDRGAERRFWRKKLKSKVR